MNCETCEQDPCACARPPLLLKVHRYEPLQDGPYLTMDEALADNPEGLACLKRLLSA